MCWTIVKRIKKAYTAFISWKSFSQIKKQETIARGSHRVAWHLAALNAFTHLRDVERRNTCWLLRCSSQHNSRHSSDQFIDFPFHDPIKYLNNNKSF